GGQFMTQMDGERHSRLRRLVMPAFAPKRLAEIDSRVGEIIEGLLDDIERGGRAFDGMQQYAARLVVGALLTAMLNLADAQKRTLLAYQEIQPQLTTVRPGQEFPPECLHAYQRSAHLVRHIIVDRRDNPRSDFSTELMLAHDQGDKLSEGELFDMIFGMFAALATTPRSGDTLYSHPDQLAQLVHDPTLIPEAVEECLRIASNGYFT